MLLSRRYISLKINRRRTNYSSKKYLALPVASITSDYHQVVIKAVVSTHKGFWNHSRWLTRVSCHLRHGWISGHTLINDIFDMATPRPVLCHKGARRSCQVQRGHSYPRESEKCLAWDATAIDSLAEPYGPRAAEATSSAAERVAEKYQIKVDYYSTCLRFCDLDLRNSRPINHERMTSFNSFDHRLTQITGGNNKQHFCTIAYLCQSNVPTKIAFHSTFVSD